jgi:hypothetical protein
MPDSIQRPTFVEAWLADIQEDVRRYGKRKLLPIALIICAVIGAMVAILVPADHFWNKPEVSVVFFTATLTMNGLLLALSWSSFAKIYEIASEPKLAASLRRNNLLNGYIFQVDYIHFTQITALICSGAALVFSVLGHLPHIVEENVSLLTIQKVGLGLVVMSSIYGLKYALGAVRLMQDLVWYVAQMPPDRADRDMTVHEGGRS